MRRDEQLGVSFLCFFCPGGGESYDDETMPLLYYEQRKQDQGPGRYGLMMSEMMGRRVVTRAPSVSVRHAILRAALLLIQDAAPSRPLGHVGRL